MRRATGKDRATIVVSLARYGILVAKEAVTWSRWQQTTDTIDPSSVALVFGT